VGLAGRRQLVRDLVAGVTATDDEGAAGRQIRRTAIASAVHVHHFRRQAIGERRDARLLERAGRKHNLVRRDRPVLELDDESIAVTPKARRRSAKAYRQVEVRCVPLEVREHLLACRVTVRIAREVKPRQAVVRARREQRERLPAIAPSRRDIVVALEDQKVAPLLHEVVADGETCLAAADHDDVVM
jgi:hypothetical protein